MEAPELQEVADPLVIVQEISAPTVAVPHLAIAEVYPRSSLAEFVNAELVGRGDHGNEINLLDSLQTRQIFCEMSIAYLTRYRKPA